jgi:hypothetical protein
VPNVDAAHLRDSRSRRRAAAKRTPSGIFARPEFALADSGLARS